MWPFAPGLAVSRPHRAVNLRVHGLPAPPILCSFPTFFIARVRHYLRRPWRYPLTVSDPYWPSHRRKPCGNDDSQCHRWEVSEDVSMAMASGVTTQPVVLGDGRWKGVHTWQAMTSRMCAMRQVCHGSSSSKLRRDSEMCVFVFIDRSVIFVVLSAATFRDFALGYPSPWPALGCSVVAEFVRLRL